MQSTHQLSGWRGGIGIAFGAPASLIPDVAELGYEIAWGAEDHPAEVARFGVSIFKYWNSIVETALKDPASRYDFSALQDKAEASLLAFDKWMEIEYGTPGLSKWAKVKYNPEGSYGDVCGTMDLSSFNPLVEAVLKKYHRECCSGCKPATGGLALDNAGNIPEEFLVAIRKMFSPDGLGIATNGCPDAYLKYVDFFGNEGFPFSVQKARELQAKGFNGILGEFTMQHLSSGELEMYLKTKLFNKIVFFGYTNGGTAAGAGNSAYAFRPDVYNHQRHVLGKYVALSRAVVAAGEESEPLASLALRNQPESQAPAAAGASAVTLDADGKVFEYQWDMKSDINGMLKSSTGTPFLRRYGKDAGKGVYFYVNSTQPETVACAAKALGINRETIVFDEFGEKILRGEMTGTSFSFRTAQGPALVQLGSARTVCANILLRVSETFRRQQLQHDFEKTVQMRQPIKYWATYCQGYEIDGAVARTGQASMRTDGGKFRSYNKWDYFNRKGAGQFLTVDQTTPAPLILTAYSKAEGVSRVDAVNLNDPAEREKHFNAREGHLYCIHLYVDYGDGNWPEVHTVSFSPGTHDWEERAIKVIPEKQVRTATVLMEFHQPEGKAWFDDLSLVADGNPGKNLLAYPGFETDDNIERRIADAKAAIDDCCNRIRKYADSMALDISGMREELAAIECIIVKDGLFPYLGYEIRNAGFAQQNISLCEHLLKG